MKKTKAALRWAITETVRRIAVKSTLRHINTIADIFARSNDADEWESLTDREWNIRSIILCIMVNASDKDIAHIQMFARHVTRPKNNQNNEEEIA